MHAACSGIEAVENGPIVVHQSAKSGANVPFESKANYLMMPPPNVSAIWRKSARGISRTSMVIASISTVVEWYDFTLYLYFATILSQVFFGGVQGSL